MATNNTKIAVLLTCFNRKDKTLHCLSDLYSQEGANEVYTLDVYLTDDGSTDGTAEAVMDKFPDIRVINGTGDLFWTRGMILAWETAVKTNKYDYFLWLNDDTSLFPNALAELLICIDKENACLVCGAFKSRKDEKFTYGLMKRNGEKIFPNGEVQHGAIINGNAVLVNYKAFELVGMLDASFPHAIGDHDYSLRLKKSGGSVLTTRSYIGYCERNKRLPKWCYAETPLAERLKTLYSPLGYAHPTYFFLYEFRHFGLFRAIKHFLSIHLRALIPSLWTR